MYVCSGSRYMHRNFNKKTKEKKKKQIRFAWNISSKKKYPIY